MNTRLLFGLLICLPLANCVFVDAGITNPTGTCTAPAQGGRDGYQAPAQGDTWLPDCNNELRREYWRVFAQSPQSAYIIPRPDGAAELKTACEDQTHKQNELVTGYFLCDFASSSAKVEAINSIDLSDALQITHYLHSQLKFEAKDNAIAPFAIPEDILDACELRPQENSKEFQAICDRELDRLKSGQEIGFDYAGPGAEELAQRLNELYGVI